MSVFVAAKNMRGSWAAPPAGAHTVDVTSAQGRGRLYRLAFSPMHVDPKTPFAAPDGTTYACFEHWWQSRKVYAGHDHAERNAWWRHQMKPKRRDPRAARGARPTHAVDPRRPNDELDYVASRKQIYVPDYLALLEGSDLAQLALKGLRSKLRRGEDVVIYDFDGPREALSKYPICKRVTVDLLCEKIHDVATPFGHGYVVAAALLGIDREEFAAV